MLKSKANTFPEETHIWEQVWENLLPFFVSHGRGASCALTPMSSPALVCPLTCSIASFLLCVWSILCLLPAQQPLLCCSLRLQSQAGGYPSPSRCLNSWNSPLKNTSNYYLFCTICFLTVSFLMWFHWLTSLSHLQYLI